MAKLSYDMLQDSQDSAPKQFSGQRVGFFNLKDDGDEAIVRFLYDSVEEFEIFSVHSIYVGGKPRKISCLRSPKEPIDNCPLCKDEQQVQQRFYVRLIQYVKDENGNIVALPKIWERSKGFAQTLKGLLDEYGPLKDNVFKVKRFGKAGTKETTYQAFFCNPRVYKPDIYPNNEELFKGYKVLGGLVIDKNFDEVQYFVDNGEFPAVEKEEKKPVQSFGTVKQTFVEKEVDDLPPWEAPVKEEPKAKASYYPQPVSDKWEENLTVNPETASRPEDAKVSYGPLVVERQVREEQPQQQSYRPVRRNYY